jgi:hypothetical protein
MTINELIATLELIRQSVGGDAVVRLEGPKGDDGDVDFIETLMYISDDSPATVKLMAAA